MVTQRYDMVCLSILQRIELAEVISHIVQAVSGDLIPIEPIVQHDVVQQDDTSLTVVGCVPAQLSVPVQISGRPSPSRSTYAEALLKWTPQTIVGSRTGSGGQR